MPRSKSRVQIPSPAPDIATLAAGEAFLPVVPKRRGSQVVRPRSAKPLSAVRFRPAPPRLFALRRSSRAAVFDFTAHASTLLRHWASHSPARMTVNRDITTPPTPVWPGNQSVRPPSSYVRSEFDKQLWSLRVPLLPGFQVLSEAYVVKGLKYPFPTLTPQGEICFSCGYKPAENVRVRC